MNDIFFTRRIKATASTLRRVISDDPILADDVQETDVVQSYRAAMPTAATAQAVQPSEPSVQKKESAKLLVLRAPLPVKEEAVLRDDNAFADMGEHNARPPANSIVEPNVTNSKLMLMARDAVESQLDELGNDRIQSIIDEVAPKSVANIFADLGSDYVAKAVQDVAPEKIGALVEKIAPSIIEGEVAVAVSDKVAERLAIELPGGMEASVGRIVQEEMQGAFGYSVTRKIRQLIREELESALKD